MIRGPEIKLLPTIFVRFLSIGEVRAPEGRQKGHLGALSIDFSAMVADRHHASKMRPHIIRRSDRRWRTRERLLHLFGDRPRSHTSPSVALRHSKHPYNFYPGLWWWSAVSTGLLGAFLMRDGDRLSATLVGKSIDKAPK